ncbi:hypothetical protein IQ07DRAFT_594910 [Pyrenochaeta sp. DS3sAY3a]|nr:hypothetical protein IQ07DRAFT_594910 [Pyrenochaeta sp. DS3sAY3a]
MTAVAAGLHSVCCAVGDTCLTNGLCAKKEWINKRNWYIRDGCTDKTWQDPACPKYCGSIEPDRNTGLVMQCPGQDSWCCAIVGGSLNDWPRRDDINTTCCSRDDLTFSAVKPVAYTIVGVANMVEFSTESQQPLSTIPILSTTVQTASATPADSSDIPTISGDAQQSASSAGLSTGAKVGLGVGIPVALIGLAAITIIFWLRRRQNAKAGDKLSGIDTTNMNGNGYVPYQDAATKQQDSTVYRHEVPSPHMAHELPAPTGLSELPPTTLAPELPAANHSMPPGSQIR